MLNTSRALVLSLSLIFSLPMVAQKAVVKGVVKSLDSSEPIEDVMVTLQGTQRFTFTDKEGNFQFSDVPYGKYHIVFNAISIESIKEELSVEKPVVVRDVRVNSTAELLDEVVVIEKSRERELIEGGYPLTMIRTEELQKRSISTLEVLDKMAGVKVRESGGLGSQTSININGLSGRAIQIYIDGLPISSYGGSSALSSIPTNLIERVEVYKGVVPAHLASDALGGVVNVVLKQVSRKNLAASYEFGSFGTHKATVSGSARIKAHGLVQGSLYYTSSKNDYQVWGDQIYYKNWDGVATNGHKARRFHDAFENYGARLHAGVQYLPWADKLLVGFSLSKGYKEVQHSGASMLNPFGGRHNRSDHGMADITYHKDNLFVEGLSLRVNSALSLQNRMAVDTLSYRFDWRGVPLTDEHGHPIINNGGERSTEKSEVHDRLASFTTRASLAYEFLGRHNVSLDYFLDGYKERGRDLRQPEVVQRTTDSYALQKHLLSIAARIFTLEDRLLLNLFGKYYFGYAEYTMRRLASDGGVEEQSMRHPHSAWGAGFTGSYKFSPTLMLVGSLERAMRLPMPNELFGSVGEDIRANSNLKPEVSINANVGVRTDDLLDNGTHSLWGQVNLFYRDTRNMIRQMTHSGTMDYLLFENLENVLGRGGDIELNYAYGSRVMLQGVFAYTSLIFNTKYDKMGQPYGYYGMQIRNEPRIRSSFTASYTQPNVLARGNTLTLSASVNYTEAFRLDWGNIGGHNLAIIPAQYPIGLSAVYFLSKQRASISVDAKNILNQQLFDNYGLQKAGFALYGKLSFAIF